VACFCNHPSLQCTYALIRSHDVSGRENSTTSRDGNDLTPVIDFIASVVDSNHNGSACQAAIDAGFLDILLRVYAIFPALERGMSALVNACTSALLMLSRQPDCLEAIIQHPVCTLWAKCSQLFREKMPNVVDDSLYDISNYV
jgi:hypothetical protein